MKNFNKSMVNTSNLMAGIGETKQVVNKGFQSLGLAINGYSFKNNRLCFECEYPGVAVLVRETNKILTGLKQHGSSFMFFKSLTDNFPVCWGTDLDSPGLINRSSGENSQNIATVTF